MPRWIDCPPHTTPGLEPQNASLVVTPSAGWGYGEGATSAPAAGGQGAFVRGTDISTLPYAARGYYDTDTDPKWSVATTRATRQIPWSGAEFTFHEILFDEDEFLNYVIAPASAAGCSIHFQAGVHDLDWFTADGGWFTEKWADIIAPTYWTPLTGPAYQGVIQWIPGSEIWSYEVDAGETAALVSTTAGTALLLEALARKTFISIGFDSPNGMIDGVTNVNGYDNNVEVLISALPRSGMNFILEFPHNVTRDHQLIHVKLRNATLAPSGPQRWTHYRNTYEEDQ